MRDADIEKMFKAIVKTIESLSLRLQVLERREEPPRALSQQDIAQAAEEAARATLKAQGRD